MPHISADISQNSKSFSFIYTQDTIFLSNTLLKKRLGMAF